MATLSTDDWDNRFNPLTDSNGDTRVMEREELRDLGATVPTNKTWTIIEGDSDDTMYIVPGYRYVNSFAYIVTEESWTDADRASEWVWA